MPATTTAANARPALFPAAAPAVLALADGTVFRGRAIGAQGASVGEVVFNTAMTGYQEILTDPSYAGQIVTLTYPHIGNVGVNAEDVESRRPFAAGLVIRDLPRLVSNFRSTGDLGAYLAANDIVGIADLDTRRLTRMLREKGAQNGCIVAGPAASDADAERGRRAGAGGAVDGGTGSRARGQLHVAVRMDRRRLGAGRGFPAGRRHALARGRLRLRHQAQHPAPAGRARVPPDGGARRDAGRGRLRPCAGRRLPVERPGRPGALRVRDPRDRDDRRRRRADVRHLPRPPAAGAGVGRPDA